MSAMSHEDSTFAMLSTPLGGQSSTADSNEFSAKIVVGGDRFVIEAIRYHLERLGDTAEITTEIIVLDAKDSRCRKIVPLATGSGVVKSADVVIKYRIRRHGVSLRSRNKSLLYDFVYEALDSYDKLF